MMKINFRLFGFLLIPLFIFGCRTTKITSTLVTTPIPIDGNMADWPKRSSVLLADSSVTVRVANDGINLYLAVETNDPEYMLDFRRSGITLWVDLNGGKSKQVEIHFPAGLYAIFDRNRGGFWQSLTPEEKERASDKLDLLAKGILVINKANEKSYNFPASNPSGFAAAYSKSRNQTTIEMRIPLQFQEDFLTMKLPLKQKTLGIGISTGSRLTGGFQRPGMAGPEEGMGRRRGYGRRGHYQSSSSENKEFWLEVNLAK
jgi:hypothetical protein